jgi:2-dehydropantoate 2-reductase
VKRIAVMGAGAVGCFFGGMLARAGADVTLIARGRHLEALTRDGLFLDSIHFQQRVSVRASAEPAAVRGAELVLFSVKTIDTETAAKSIAPHLSRGAIVLSLQNGVDNVARIAAAAGLSALASVVYVAASLPEPGRVRHAGRGDLVIGNSPAQQVAAIRDTFEPAGVPCRLSDNLDGELWQKLTLNCCGNAVSALTRSGYGPAVRNPFVREVMQTALDEARAVAQAAGVRLPDDGPENSANAMNLLENYGSATSSTEQDIARGRRTEMDSLNGYVARRGAELGVPTPVNRTLYALVKLLEEQSLAGASQSAG